MNQPIIELLKRVRSKLNGATDMEVEKRLNVPRGTLAKWRMGSKRMESAIARAIAEILGEHPDVMELQVDVACASDQRAKETYSRLLKEKLAELSRS